MSELAFHDAEAERAVLGAALLDPSTLDLTALGADAFFSPRHQLAWAAMQRLHAAGEPIDPLTVADSCAPEYRPDVRETLTDLLVCAFTTQNVEHYAGMVRRHHVTRQVMLVASTAVEDARRGAADGEELLNRLTGKLGAIEFEQTESAVEVGALVLRRLRQIDEQLAEDVPRGFVPSGVAALDQLIGGHRRGIVTICAGRSGMGKSSLAISAADACSSADLGVHIFTLEDSEQAYTDRLLSRYSGVPVEDIGKGRLGRDDLRLITDAANALSKRRGWLVDPNPYLSAGDIVRSVRRNRKRNDTALVVVDYLQLLKKQHPRQKAHEAMGQNTIELASAAKADGMAYLALSQVNRKVDSRDDKRPRLGDLREGGESEERAKCVLGVYREDDWDEVEIPILKNNQGRTGYVKGRWHGPTTRLW